MEQAELKTWIESLELEHRDLDEVIAHLIATGHSDSLRIARLKHRKLKLKDMLLRLRSQLIPDLDA